MNTPQARARKPAPDSTVLVAYEEGELDEEGTLEMFQGLVDSGLAWRLQGSYGRAAANLIDAGLIADPRS